MYKGIVEDVKTRFGPSNYELDRPLHKGENDKVVGLTKDNNEKMCWIKRKHIVT